MQKLTLLILMLCLLSCVEQEAKLNIYSKSDFTIVDSAFDANCYITQNEVSDYPIYYIGPKKDTIFIGKQYLKTRTKWNVQLTNTSIKTNSSLKIFVDTSIKTNSPLEYISDSHEANKSLTKNYHSFLLTLENTCNKPIFIGRTFYLINLRREAKNKYGRWIEIEKDNGMEWICFTDEPYITLNPKEIIISKLRRYSGSFLTEFRIVYKTNEATVYSNTFKDFIDESVLNSN